jgi:uncharacterized membrane protein
MTTNNLRKIQDELNTIKRIIEKKPERFAFQKEVGRAFFGALLVGVIFIFKGALFTIAQNINWSHIILMILSTILILVLGIYFIGYLRVKGEEGRNAFEFILKRLPTIYTISFLVSVFLIYLFGIDEIFTGNIWKLIFIVTLPCSTGAAVADLLKKY